VGSQEKEFRVRLLLALAVLVAAGAAGLLASPGPGTASADTLPFLPKPASAKAEPGRFLLTSESRILVDSSEECMHLGEYLSQVIRQTARIILPISLRGGDGSSSPNTIVLTTDKSKASLGPEGYELGITPREIRIRSISGAGIFYGIQTLRQLMPEPVAEQARPAIALPCLRIEDRPRFGWRGLNLDCGRHFMSKEYVKRTIDLLARHKMNRLHWHLTEDQGWRIEIKKYPNFTQKGAWRKTEDGAVSGGFYTQDDVREVVAYAQSRYVTVVPEIEMPGHSVAALASYPELSCTGGPFEVQNWWGIHPDVYCAGNERTFEVLEDVLTEVMDLFPSPYIHIGGDECPKDRWRACPKCQARIKAEGLKDEVELQSYFIKRIAAFLRSKNRRVIGWDEILDGGLAPGATVQSWRGFEGAAAAARAGHDTIVSPTKYTYFDYDLARIDLRLAFEFEPVPDGLTAAERGHILGGECNMWSERTPEDKVDGMLFPRILALAERLWSPEKDRDFDDFERRAWRQGDRLKLMGVQVGDETQALRIVPVFRPETRRVTVLLKPAEKDLVLRVTTDGSTPSLQSPRYDSPLTILTTCQVRARAFKGDRPYGEVESRPVVIHQALGKTVKRLTPYQARRSGGGDGALTDGIRSNAETDDGAWQGTLGQDLDAIVDLGGSTPIRRVAVGFLQDSSHDVFLPLTVDFSVSDDGTNYRQVGRVVNVTPKDDPTIVTKDFGVPLPAVQGRYLRVTARNIGTLPPPHPRAGAKAWLFTDEIIVE
jgi:hexosaminidase